MKLIDIKDKGRTFIVRACLTSPLWGVGGALVSCSDTWSEHYDAAAGTMADQPSLQENIKANPRLKEFYRVIEAIGAEGTLASPQQLTLWAPLDMTARQADSVIAIYQQGVAEGLKRDDNRAITQFLNNHLALYTRNLSSTTADTLSMLNGKYMRLTGKSDSEGTLAKMDGTEPNRITSKTVANNGILYTTEHIQPFFPNVREYLEQNADIDSLYRFLRQFDEYELNEALSVPGEINSDGKTEYVDSVTTLYNRQLTKYGFIQREDSVYTLIAPTNEVWRQQYEKYSQYYQYDPSVMNADSLRDINTHQRILEGRTFNTSTDWLYNRSADSLCNTQYMERQSHYPRQNVYYQPYGPNGILAGLRKVECSNGSVYIDPRGVIDPRSTFFSRMDIEASSPRYYEIPLNSSNEPTMNVANMSFDVYTDTTKTEVDHTYYFAQVTAKTASAQTELVYKLPSTLSGCYYNIYLVTIPADNNLPAWMVVQHQEVNEKGAFPTSYKYYDNPNPVTAASDVPNADVIAKQSNSQRIFSASGVKVDTMLVQAAVQFPYSGYGLNDAVVRFKVNSVGPSSSSYREKIYTRTLRLNEFILVPFETKEEAEQAAANTDAFNDKLLEANQKK